MRRHDLDWLRVMVFWLLIFYHVGMFFNPWGWHIKNDVIYEWIRYPMLFLNQWRLPILFVISGMGTYYALSKRTGGQFAWEPKAGGETPKNSHRKQNGIGQKPIAKNKIYQIAGD